MFIGFRMMLSLLEALGDVIPFIGDLLGSGASMVAFLLTVVVAPVIIAIAWVLYRPLVALVAIAAGAALAFGVRALARRRVAAPTGST